MAEPRKTARPPAAKKTRAKKPTATNGAQPLPPGAIPRRRVTFMEREIEVKAPTPETLARWGRDIARFQKHPIPTDLEGIGKFADFIDELWEILFGLIVHEDDIEWMKTGIRKNEISLLNAHQIMEQAAGAYENRAARRAK